MGVDTKIRLRGNTGYGNIRIRDVATAVAILWGNKPVKQELGGYGGKAGSWGVKLPDVSVKGIESLPECADIYFPYQGKMARVLYHFEVEGGGRLLMPRMCPEWQRVGKALVDLFGGEVDYCDSDFTDVDYSHTVDYRTDPEDGEEWQRWQERIFNLKPAVDWWGEEEDEEE